MKALVTGARGFIGSFLVENLIKTGVEVQCLLRKKNAGEGWLSGLDFKHIEGDITVPSSLETAVKDVDYVFHLAGSTKSRTGSEFKKINADGTKNLLETTRKTNSGLKRFLLVSSLAAAGPSLTGRPLTEEDKPQPVSHYGISKLKAEEFMRNYSKDMPVTIVRPPSVYGPRDTDVFSYFKYAKHGIRPILSGGPRRASFIYVKDLVQGIMLAAEKDAALGQTYFLCDDDAYTWDELGVAISAALNVTSRRIVLPLSLAFIAAAIADIFCKMTNRTSIINLDKYNELKMNYWICSNEKAKRELGFKTKYSLEEGLRETAEWYIAEGWI